MQSCKSYVIADKSIYIYIYFVYNAYIDIKSIIIVTRMLGDKRKII